MRRVLHVIRTAGVSGAENHLLALARELPALGWTADFLVGAPDPRVLDGFAHDLAAAGGRVRTFAMPHDASPHLLRRLRRALRDPDGADLVHTHLVHADWHGGLAAVGRTRVPLVSTKHNHDPFRALLPFRVLESAWLRRCAAAIAISDSLADFVDAHHGRRPTTVRYGWPVPDDVEPGRTGPPHELLAAGRLEPQKGYEVLVEAVGLLRDAGHDVRLRIAGEGGQRELLEARIRARGLDDHVTLLGQRGDVPALMRAADVFVHTARWEGFGLVLLEAMAAGLPVVATAVGAIPEVVADGETALLTPPDDPPAFAAAVARLVEDPARAQRMGAAGVERLRTEFAPRRMAERTVAVYEQALRGGRP